MYKFFFSFVAAQKGTGAPIYGYGSFFCETNPPKMSDLNAALAFASADMPDARPPSIISFREVTPENGEFIP